MITAPTLFARHKPCDFWFFGVLKEVLKDRQFNLSNEIEQVTAMVWDELTFDEVQSVFHKEMSRFAWVIENGRGYIIK
jgi:hypothetical protein